MQGILERSLVLGAAHTCRRHAQAHRPEEDEQMRHMNKNLGVESDSGMDGTGRGQEREAEDSHRASPLTRAALLRSAKLT